MPASLLSVSRVTTHCNRPNNQQSRNRDYLLGDYSNVAKVNSSAENVEQRAQINLGPLVYLKIQF
jgi:hypothetical protein